MKICLVTEFFYPDMDATPKILSELSRYLVSNYDINIDVITTQNLCRTPGARLPAYEDWDGIRIHRMKVPQSNRFPGPFRLLAGVFFANSALKMLMNHKTYDIVVVGTNPPAAPRAALEYKRRTGTPYVYIIHDLHPDIAVAIGALSPDGLAARISRNHQKRWLENASKITVLGQYMKEHVITSYGVSEERSLIVPNWEDPTFIKPAPVETKFRADNNLTGFVALYTGNIGLSHGIGDVLNAANLLKDDPGFTFVLVGAGKQLGSVAAGIQRLKLSNVRLFPYVPQNEYPDLLASANVCLLSQKPGIGNLAVPSRLYSYMASGRPIIAVVENTSDVSRMLRDYECGITVNPGDPQGLADALSKLRTDNEQLEKLGNAAREALVTNYTIQHSGSLFADMLLSVVNK